jgi:hypothetical protein
MTQQVSNEVQEVYTFVVQRIYRHRIHLIVIQEFFLFKLDSQMNSLVHSNTFILQITS